jgi:hypothetical protein
MDMPAKPTHYHSFLLRLWRGSDTPAWRFSLEDPHTGQRRGFADWAQLVEFLKEVMEPAKPNDSLDPSV